MPKFGKVQVAERNTLTHAEKRYGVTWSELNAYKDKMCYPVLPPMMPPDAISRQTSLCETVFRGLDRCMEQGLRSENPSQPYARMQICKPHWIRFIKCVKRRDEEVLKDIRHWERWHVGRLEPKERERYMEDIDIKAKYFQYAAAQTTDEERRKRLELNAQHCARRQKALESTFGDQ